MVQNEEIIIDIYNNPLHAEIFKACHRLVENTILSVEKEKYENLFKAFEYLVSRLPEECTAGFVTHARAIASGDKDRIERTK